jgi:predicted outer membrane repeat protein
VYANVGTAALAVNNSTFEENAAASGGAIRRFNALVEVVSSSFTSNGAQLDGGGISSGFGGSVTDPTTLNVTNSTFTGNSAASGGGIYNDGYAVLNSLTLKDNQDGIFVGTLAVTTHLGNSVLDNPGFENCETIGPAIIEDSTSLSTDNTCPVSIVGTPAQLGPLTTNSNGVNATKYHAPAPEGPLVNTGSACPPLDQLGAARAGACDIGAVEFAPPQGTIVDLFEGWNPVLWERPEAATAIDVISTLDVLVADPVWEAVAFYDEGDEEWLQTFRQAPLPSLNTLTALEEGNEYWIFVNSSTQLGFPPK